MNDAARQLATRGIYTTAATVELVAGVTYRRLDYWTRTRILRPSISESRGTGHPRYWSAADIVAARVVLLLRDGNGVAGHPGGASYSTAAVDMLRPIVTLIQTAPPAGLADRYVVIVAGSAPTLLTIEEFAGVYRLAEQALRPPFGLRVVPLRPLVADLIPAAA